MREYRAIQELRVDGHEKPTIVGHAAVFNKSSELLFDGISFREIIKPGAFADTIRENQDIFALWQHDPKIPLGRVRNKTLELSEDDIGLAVRIHPPDAMGVDFYLESINRGDVDGMSFAFEVADGGEKWDLTQRPAIRELTKVRLYEVSPVTWPAYQETDVSLRSFYEIRLKTAADNRPPEPKQSNEELREAYLRRKARLNARY